MESRTFDALTRRASLLTLGSAGLASLMLPLTGAAKKKHRKNRNKNKNKGDVNKLCKTQVGQCESFIAATCQGEPVCLAQAPCCATLGTCDFTGLIACLEALQAL